MSASNLIEATPEAIERVLCGEFEEAINEAIEAWPGASAEQRGRVLNWIRERRDEIINFARDVEDPDQLKESLSLNYLQLYSKWLMINAQFGYQIGKGIVDMELQYRNTCLSLLQHSLEKFLDTESLKAASDTVTDMGLNGANNG